MQSEDNTAATTLHSLSTRPHYEWTQSEVQVNILQMDIPIHSSSKPMTTADRRSIIETYPPVAQLEYRSPATLPSAEQAMNQGEKMEDNSLKQLQYQASAILCPLDVLGHEMLTHDSNNANLERFCTILVDMRSLVLIDLCSTIAQAHSNIAYRAINPTFTLKAEPEVGYTVPPEEFQQGINQQTATKKAIRKASSFRRPRRRFHNSYSSSGSYSNESNQQFFWQGPPSQQGGFNGNSTNNSNFSSNSNNFRANHHNSNNNTKKNTNPFRHQ
ncbi:hypothetical protein [Parasitella parasitica]|nr:hypothetical protein [Parasitella parasitica]